MENAKNNKNNNLTRKYSNYKVRRNTVKHKYNSRTRNMKRRVNSLLKGKKSKLNPTLQNSSF